MIEFLVIVDFWDYLCTLINPNIASGGFLWVFHHTVQQALIGSPCLVCSALVGEMCCIEQWCSTQVRQCTRVRLKSTFLGLRLHPWGPGLDPRGLGLWGLGLRPCGLGLRLDYITGLECLSSRRLLTLFPQLWQTGNWMICVCVCREAWFILLCSLSMWQAVQHWA